MQYSSLGIGLLLFAILLEMCSSGFSAMSLCIGVVGLIILGVSSLKHKDKYWLFVRWKGVISQPHSAGISWMRTALSYIRTIKNCSLILRRVFVSECSGKVKSTLRACTKVCRDRWILCSNGKWTWEWADYKQICKRTGTGKNTRQSAATFATPQFAAGQHIFNWNQSSDHLPGRNLRLPRYIPWSCLCWAESHCRHHHSTV